MKPASLAFKNFISMDFSAEFECAVIQDGPNVVSKTPPPWQEWTWQDTEFHS